MATRFIWSKIVGDLLLIIIVVLGIVLFKEVGSPFRRGLFCDDQSIKYPYRQSTIPDWLLYVLTLIGPVVVMTMWEMIATKANSMKLSHPVFIFHITSLINSFLFGLAATHFVTDISKYTTGRLRPYFFSVCIPDWSNITCAGSSYIENYICMGDQNIIREARLSFPSGHASLSMYSVAFMVEFIQRKFTWQGLNLMKPFLQSGIFYVGYYIAISRIFDYKHHWDDVLAGIILGLVGGFLTVLKVANLEQCTNIVSNSKNEDTNRMENNIEVLKDDAK